MSNSRAKIVMLNMVIEHYRTQSSGYSSAPKSGGRPPGTIFSARTGWYEIRIDSLGTAITPESQLCTIMKDGNRASRMKEMGGIKTLAGSLVRIVISATRGQSGRRVNESHLKDVVLNALSSINFKDDPCTTKCRYCNCFKMRSGQSRQSTSDLNTLALHIPPPTRAQFQRGFLLLSRLRGVKQRR